MLHELHRYQRLLEVGGMHQVIGLRRTATLHGQLNRVGEDVIVRQVRLGDLDSFDCLHVETHYE